MDCWMVNMGTHVALVIILSTTLCGSWELVSKLIQTKKASISTCRFPSRPCTLPLLSYQNYTFIHLSPLASLYTISLLSACLISPNPFLLGFIEAFISFHIKRTGNISFLWCFPFMAENWRNFRSLYFSFLTVTLACHYWGFLCPPCGSEAPRTQHCWDKGHQLHPLLRIHLFIPASLLIPPFLFIACLVWLGDILTFPLGFLTWPAAETLAMVASDTEIVVSHLHLCLLVSCFVCETIGRQCMWLSSFSSLRERYLTADNAGLELIWPDNSTVDLSDSCNHWVCLVQQIF